VQSSLHWVNLRILLPYGAYKLTSVSPQPRSKKEAQDTIEQLQARTPRVGWSTFVSDVVAIPLQHVTEEGTGDNEVVQQVNLAANATANAIANPPANAAANTAGNVANNAANAAGAQQNAAANAG
jgi:hypothetical protein